MLGPVLVTGATGWIGTALLEQLRMRGIETVALTRRTPRTDGDSARWIQIDDDFGSLAERWPEGVSAVVHLAARVHQMNDSATDPLTRYRSTNRDATLRLAELGRAHGVKRFIFLSSIKALGEIEPGHPWRESDTPAPTDPYGISKLEAEMGLKDMMSEHFSPTIVRIPLVYGAGVSANFASLMKAVQRGVPLPLGAATAPRSLLGMDNLIDALLTCLDRPQAAGQLLHIADQEALPVRDLVLAIGVALNRKARLINVPLEMLHTVGRLLGRSEQVMRLTNPLRVDISHAQSLLGWSPKYSLTDGLRAACAPLVDR
jgi:UDP-glucose 4-epimerase